MQIQRSVPNNVTSKPIQLRLQTGTFDTSLPDERELALRREGYYTAWVVARGDAWFFPKK